MTQNTQSLIKEIETKISETQLLITNHKKEIANKENLLQSLINQLTKIKKDMNLNNENNNAENSEINN